MQNGDEIVTELNGSTGDYLQVARPRLFQVMQNPETGVFSGGLYPWIYSCPDAKCDIRRESIVTLLDADDDLAKSYLKAVSSIQLFG